MSVATLDPQRAGRLVRARLGRDPQDMLEAAVVLEAWGGVPAGRALEAGRAVMAAQAPAQESSAGPLPEAPPREGIAAEAISFVLAVLAIACWAMPLADAVGADVVRSAVLVALPLTSALQWGLRSRYLGRPDALAQLRRGGRRAAGVAAVLASAVVAALGAAGAIAVLLTLTWTGGTVLIRRGWPGRYAACVVAAAAAMLAGVAPEAVVGATAAVTALAVVVALRGSEPRPVQTPGSRRRAATATLIGAGLGALLVADPTVDWTVGAVPALALLPSTVASFWGGSHLWRFQQVIPRALAGLPVTGSAARNPAWPALRVLAGAAARLVVATAVLSAILVVLTESFGSRTTAISVLAGFGLVALATLVVSLLESVGRSGWALLSVVAAIAAEVAVRQLDDAPFAAAGLIAGAGIALLVAVPAAVALLARPARTLATSLWIT
jgi:hypothetical protein